MQRSRFCPSEDMNVKKKKMAFNKAIYYQFPEQKCEILIPTVLDFSVLNNYCCFKKILKHFRKSWRYVAKIQTKPKFERMWIRWDYQSYEFLWKKNIKLQMNVMRNKILAEKTPEAKWKLFAIFAISALTLPWGLVLPVPILCASHERESAKIHKIRINYLSLSPLIGLHIIETAKTITF